MIPENKIAAVVTSTLNDNFGFQPTSNLEHVIDQFQPIVQQLAMDQVHRWIANHIPSAMFSGSFNTFNYKGNKYQIQVAPKIGSPTIQFAILPVQPSVHLKTLSHSLKIDSFGLAMYSEVGVLCDTDLPLTADELNSYLSQIFFASHAWLYEFIRSRFHDLESEVSNELYTYTRSLLRPDCQSEVLASLLFAVQSKSRSQYVLDAPAMESIVQFFAKRNISAPISLAKLFMEMVSGDIDFENSFAKIAIGKRECIDINLAKSKYSKDNALFEIAEELHFNAFQVSVFPIHADNEPFLCAVFPTSFKPVLLEPLMRNRQALDDFYSARQTKIKRLLKSMNTNLKVNFDWSTLGEFVGGFVRGFSH